MKFPFSLIINDGVAFPNMPMGELIVFGRHDQAIAECDYDGNLDRVHPDMDSTKNESERFVLINNDRYSIMAWHGQRKNQFDHFDNGRRLGLINWQKALHIEEAKSNKRNKRNG